MTILICKRDENKKYIIDTRYLCGDLEAAKKDYPDADLIVEGEGFNGDEYIPKTKEIITAPKPQRDPKQQRAEEYSAIDHEFIEALAEKEEGRPEKMAAYLTKRQAIRARFPDDTPEPIKPGRTR